MKSQQLEPKETKDLRDVSDKMTELANRLNELEQEKRDTTDTRDTDSPSFDRLLAESGYSEDILIASPETISMINSENKMEILETLKEKDVESIQELANEIDRDYGNLSRDLDKLFQHDIISYKMEKNRKIPQLKHKTIVSKPINLKE